MPDDAASTTDSLHYITTPRGYIYIRLLYNIQSGLAVNRIVQTCSLMILLALFTICVSANIDRHSRTCTCVML